MLVLVTYDVETLSENGRRRLRKVAKICENYGQRVQNSVFECLVDSTQLISFSNQLEQVIDKNKDSLRFYYLGNNWKRRIEHIGAHPAYDPQGLLLI